MMALNALDERGAALCIFFFFFFTGLFFFAFLTSLVFPEKPKWALVCWFRQFDSLSSLLRLTILLFCFFDRSRIS